MALRYRVKGFVTYGDDRGRRCPIPVGELVDVEPASDGSGTMTWHAPSGQSWSEALSDRLLAHYTMSQLEPLAPHESGTPPERWRRGPSGELRHRRRV
jgi:hypothetical protein